jgi:hypothetical protein
VEARSSLANFSTHIRIVADSTENFSYLNAESLLNWWYFQSELKVLYEVVAYLVVQPSSGASERIFSLLDSLEELASSRTRRKLKFVDGGQVWLN